MAIRWGVRYALYLALISGCSYEHGIFAGGGERDAAALPDDAPARIDAAVDPDASRVAVDAPIDAHTCSNDFTPLSGGQPTSRYKRYSYSGGAANIVDFMQASAICTSAGGYVAIPNNEAELEAFDNISQNPAQPGYWIGITDQTTEGEWRTVLGNLATFLPWSSAQGGQPNGGVGANCAVGYDEEIYDVACTMDAYVFICECTP